jgi:hypothetical protein
MAKHVGASGLVDQQHMMAHRLPQHSHQPLGVLADHRGQQLVVHSGAGHRRRLQHPLGGLRQPLHPGQHQVAQGRRQPGALPVGGQQLLGKNRVALRARQDLPHQHRRHRPVQDPTQQLGQLLAVQPAKLQPLDPAAAVQLGQQRPQRVAAVQLIGAVAQHQRDPAAQVPDHKAQQVAGGLVGPVQVLDHQQHRPTRGQPVQHPQQQLEQPRWRQRRRCRLAGGSHAQLGDQPSQLPAGAAQDLCELLRIQGAGQRAQRLDHRRVGQHTLTHVQAAATEYHHPGLGGVVGQLGDQAGLADAGFARTTTMAGWPLAARSSSAPS